MRSPLITTLAAVTAIAVAALPAVALGGHNRPSPDVNRSAVVTPADSWKGGQQAAVATVLRADLSKDVSRASDGKDQPAPDHDVNRDAAPDAAADKPAPRVEPAPPVAAAPVDAVPVERDRPTDIRPDIEQERLELACELRRHTTDTEADATRDVRRYVACKWTQARHPHAEGYRLLRAVGDHGREVIFRTRDLTANGYRDADLTPGQIHHYAVQAVNADGKIVGQSNTVRVKVGEPDPQPEPELERLKLECGPTSSGIACHWSTSQLRAFAGYVLTRVASNSDERVQVFATREHGQTRYLDAAIEKGVRYTYVVTSRNADGESSAAAQL